MRHTKTGYEYGGYIIYDNKGIKKRRVIKLQDDGDASILTSHLNELNDDYRECVARKNIIIEKLKPYHELANKYYQPSSTKFAEFVDNLYLENMELKQKVKTLEDTKKLEVLKGNKDVCIILKSGIALQGNITNVSDGIVYLLSEDKNIIVIDEIAVIKVLGGVKNYGIMFSSEIL